MKKRFKLATVFTIIASAFCIFNGFIGAIGLFFDEVYNSIWQYFMSQVDVSNINDPEIYEFLEYLQTILRVALIGANVLAGLSAIPSLVFAIICSNHNEYSVEAFQRKNGLHIAFLVFIGISMNFSAGGSTASFVSDLFSLLDTVAAVFLTISFIFALIEIIQNYRSVKSAEKYCNVSTQEVKPTFEDKVEQQKPLEAEITPVVESEKEVKVVKQDNLEDLYNLIAKLEKSYKDGEISQEDYERMKQTIINNYYES